jgi:hypothetical protein
VLHYYPVTLDELTSFEAVDLGHLDSSTIDSLNKIYASSGHTIGSPSKTANILNANFGTWQTVSLLEIQA